MTKYLKPRGVELTLDHLKSATVAAPSGCWVWQRYIDTDGYGRILDKSRRSVGVHRVAWSLANGPIPEGLVIDHLCFVRSCINPDHLRAVTKFENDSRQYSTLSPTCAGGHPRTSEHGRRVPGRGWHCQTCTREGRRERTARRRAAQLSESGSTAARLAVSFAAFVTIFGCMSALIHHVLAA